MAFETEPDRLTALVATLERAASALTGDAQRLDDAASTLASAWQGEAQAAFRRTHSSAMIAFDEHIGTLRAAAAAVDAIAALYAATDRNGAQAVPH